MPNAKKRVVVLDDDRDVAEVIQTILIDEGFAVSCLYGPDAETVHLAVKELAPDCVILDGGGPKAADIWAVARSLGVCRCHKATSHVLGDTNAVSLPT